MVLSKNTGHSDVAGDMGKNTKSSKQVPGARDILRFKLEESASSSMHGPSNVWRNGQCLEGSNELTPFLAVSERRVIRSCT